jgi:AcrR family transcriptional regulator
MTAAPSHPPPRRGRPGYDQASLVEVAAGLFNERGYDGTSMEDLAGRLGITKSAIYHHVSSKEELLGLIVERALEQLDAAVDHAVSRPGRAITRLEELVRASIAVLVDRLAVVTVLLRVRGNTATEQAALQRRRALDHAVTRLVAKAIAEGDLRSDLDPATTARLLFGLVNSLVEWYRPGSGATAADVADAVAVLAFDGLRSRRT